MKVIKTIKDKILVEESRRITARHIRELEKANVTALVVPEDYLFGMVLYNFSYNRGILTMR